MSVHLEMVDVHKCVSTDQAAIAVNVFLDIPFNLINEIVEDQHAKWVEEVVIRYVLIQRLVQSVRVIVAFGLFLLLIV